MASKSFVFRFADVEVREREFSLLKAGEAVPVEPKAFRVLLILLRNPQKLIAKEELLNAVWGDAAVTENSLTRSIALLRRLLGDDTHNPRFIETVATVGYRWVCKVEVAEETSGAEEPPPEAVVLVLDEKKRGSWTRKWIWVLAGGGVVALCLAGALWYLRRPLPPLRIAAYTQITHDGRAKSVGGTDGSRVYFTENSPSQIAEVGVNGGEIALLPVQIPAVAVQLMDISRDGSHALVGAYGQGGQGQVAPSQWVVPILGGAVKRLEDAYGEAFSPDGGSVVYSSPNWEIFTVHVDGSGKRKLASVGSLAWWFRWSPDGKVIRFSKDGGLWEMSQDGAGVHRLLPGWKEGVPCCGQWTHDGGYFLFLASGQIWALDERRSLSRQPSAAPIQLTSGPLQWGAPIPGKDGKTIFVDGDAARGELVRIDLKTGSPQPFLGGISAEFASFSPDGKSVAYVTFPEGILWRANRDGSNRMQLTQPPYSVANPRWSPDGKEILFADISGPTAVGYIVLAEGGSPQRFLPESNEQQGDPNWSQDGHRIVFESGVPTDQKSNRLSILDLANHQVTTVPGSAGLRSPRWSPDGRKIAASAPQSAGLRVFDLATQQWRTLLCCDGEDEEFPSFSGDSRFIYFLRPSRDEGVFRIPVGGGKAERVVNMTDWHLTGSWGFSMSLDPEDAPLVTRDTGSDDIYALTLEER